MTPTTTVTTTTTVTHERPGAAAAAARPGRLAGIALMTGGALSVQLGAGLSALLYVPVGIWALASHPVTVAALGRAAVAGVLCSAVPMVGDVLALRRVPARFFGVFMSVNPVFAALTGLVVLGQSLAPADWLAIAAIVTANAVSVSRGDRPARSR